MKFLCISMTICLENMAVSMNSIFVQKFSGKNLEGKPVIVYMISNTSYQLYMDRLDRIDLQCLCVCVCTKTNVGGCFEYAFSKTC